MPDWPPSPAAVCRQPVRGEYAQVPLSWAPARISPSTGPVEMLWSWSVGRPTLRLTSLDGTRESQRLHRESDGASRSRKRQLAEAVT